MASNTPVAETESSPSRCRARKRGTPCVPLLDRSADRERAPRWATTNRVLEEFGATCDSPSELGVIAEVSDTDDFAARALMSADGDHEELAQLRELIMQTAAISARVAACAQEIELRTLCFAFAQTCQIAQSQIRKQQLWSVERRL